MNEVGEVFIRFSADGTQAHLTQVVRRVDGTVHEYVAQTYRGTAEEVRAYVDANLSRYPVREDAQ